MDCEERQESSRRTPSVVKAKERKVLVDIVLVLSSLGNRIGEVGGGGTIEVRVEEGRVADVESPLSEPFVRSLNGNDDSGEDRIVRLLDETERSELRQEDGEDRESEAKALWLT